MNTALALEIYRGIWFMGSSEPGTFKNMLHDARTAVYNPEERLNTFSFLSPFTGLMIPVTGNQNDSKNEKKIAVTNINGVITKSGGSSSRGMQELSADMMRADKDPDVIGHLVKVDSPGGSEPGMRYMMNTMNGLKKPIVTFVTRQGQAASGGYGILSQGNYVMAESDDAEIGSHGVMWGTSGVPNGEKDGNGEVSFIVVSSSSPDKNKAPLDAINHKDTTLMQAKVDELHTQFKTQTLSKRPNLTEKHMSGGMFAAKDVVGTMIDAIGTQSDAVNKILELSKTKNTFIKNNQTESKAMTKAQLKSENPELYAEIFGEGVTAERDRVGAWMAYNEADPEAVQKGIDSGKDITQKESHSLLVKMHSKTTLTGLKKDSPEKVITPPAEGAEVVLTDEQKEFKAAYPKAKLFPNEK